MERIPSRLPPHQELNIKLDLWIDQDIEVFGLNFFSIYGTKYALGYIDVPKSFSDVELAIQRL